LSNSDSNVEESNTTTSKSFFPRLKKTNTSLKNLDDVVKVEDLPKPGFSYIPLGGESLIKKKESGTSTSQKFTSIRKLSTQSLPAKVKPINPDEKTTTPTPPNIITPIPNNPLSAKPAPSLTNEKPLNFDRQNRGAIQLGSSSSKPKTPLFSTQKVTPTPKPNIILPNNNNIPIQQSQPINSNTTKKPLASFVDPKKNPMHYVNRYVNEPKYKEWFEKNYPNMTIYEAVGLEEKKDPSPDQAPHRKLFPNLPNQKPVDQSSGNVSYKAPQRPAPNVPTQKPNDQPQPNSDQPQQRPRFMTATEGPHRPAPNIPTQKPTDQPNLPSEQQAPHRPAPSIPTSTPKTENTFQRPVPTGLIPTKKN